MALTFLWRWLTRAAVQRPDLLFLLYTRAACPLCDDALAVLQRRQRRHGFKLEIKNVDDAEELVRAYGNCVPVVLVNGKVRFRGRINEVLLERILMSEPQT
jgi:glutaredoxin